MSIFKKNNNKIMNSKNYIFSTSLICLNQIKIFDDINKIFTNYESVKSSYIDKIEINNHLIKETDFDNLDFNWMHADFMDGSFVPRLGITPELIQHIKKEYKSYVKIDSHLMVDDPYSYADVIAPYSDIFSFHWEATSDPMRTIQKIRKNWPQVKIGIYLNLTTPVSVLNEISSEVDAVGFMGISPGVLGTNSYKEIVKKKVNESDCKKYDYSMIDGSVNFETIPAYGSLVKSDNLLYVCGTSSIVNKNGTIKENIDKIIKNIFEAKYM